MSSPCLVMNRVGSIEPFENPSDTRKLESSSYHALEWSSRKFHYIESYQTDEVLPALINHAESAIGFFDVSLVQFGLTVMRTYTYRHLFLADAVLID
ncbi:hypothetical protein Tco_0427548 [Tanacetum coccineum]